MERSPGHRSARHRDPLAPHQFSAVLAVHFETRAWATSDSYRIASSVPIHLIADSTGLSIVGQGEWAVVKQEGSGKRTWKKLHFGVDRSGSIVAEVRTDGNADDSNTALNRERPQSDRGDRAIALEQSHE